MVVEILFIVSGVMIAILILAKLWEEKKKSPVFILAGISRADGQMRIWSHNITEYYAKARERVQFLVYKQLPLRSKNIFYKTTDKVKEKTKEYIGDIRGSKFLKKSDGISEFFQSLSEMENGNGRIDETLDIGDENKASPPSQD